MVAVVAHSRSKLEALAADVIDHQGGPTAQLTHLVQGLLAHVEANPGLPRLLFSDGLYADDELGANLRQLSSMQIALVTELVRQGQGAGELAPELEPRFAATVFVGMIQGLIVQWLLSGRPAGLVDDAEAALAYWLRGAKGSGEAPPPKPPAARDTAGVASLDVRPILASGADPLDPILEALAGVADSGVLIVSAPFRPKPLIRLLTGKGHAVEACEVPDGWSVHIVVGGAVAIEDLRDLPAPEPLEQVLERCVQLPPGAVYLARLPRFPKMLVPQLTARGVTPEIETIADGSALLRIVGRA